MADGIEASFQIEDQAVLGHFINGEFADGKGQRSAPVMNPATGEELKRVSLATMSEAERAIASARNAWPAWRDLPPLKRARIMFRYRELLELHADRIAAIITAEHGKVIDDAMGEFRRGIEVVEYACGAPELLKGEHAKNVGPSIDSWSEFQPIGVVAGITPFNFPAMVPMWMFPMALVCGNCFILKPSEKDPTVALVLADLLAQAGLPDGVFNVLNGDKEAVDILLTHDDVEVVSFVGSTPIAEYIYEMCSKHGKRVQALGGAKNHAIVMPDADLDNATNALMGAAFGSCGERCMAISVAVCVGEETADAMVDRLTQALGTLKIGPGSDASNHMGPLITSSHKAKVESYVELGVKEGAELLVDGRNLKVDGHDSGYFLGGCLFDRVTKEMRIYKEEIFGPVLCIVRANSQEEAMALINDHEFGNGTCIFTRDGQASRYFTDRIKVGMVGVNVPLPVPVAVHSFGGWKKSLFGDLYAYGPDSVRFYTRRKTISQRWPTGGIRDAAQFSFPNGASE